MNVANIPSDHPRAKSLLIRERLIEWHKKGIVTTSGLMAHGRGEAFDYLLGEKTSEAALKSTETCAAALLKAKKAVVSVNGNTAALVAEDIVKLADIVGAAIEVNLFYRSLERESAIKKLLEEAGARKVLGVGEAASARIPELNSERRRVDPRGILTADVVLVPLEDGDRTEALIKMGKKVIAIDLNPLSRTAQKANITIVDNIVRAAPNLIKISERLRKRSQKELEKMERDFDNKQNLATSISLMIRNLSTIASKGLHSEWGNEENGMQ
jgi:4-phosphopantoate--beta-alanine ligase